MPVGVKMNKQAYEQQRKTNNDQIFSHIMNDPVLYLIPIELAPGTGIGVLGTHLQDTIRETQLFFVENVRTARRFISSLNLDIDISTLEFHVLNKHTEAAELSNYPKLRIREDKRCLDLI